MKLDVKALALSCGLIWGLGLFLVTWWVILLDGASGEVTWLGHVTAVTASARWAV